MGASLGIPYITAHRALAADEPVDESTVLVTAGAGAVGHAAVQLGTFLGTRVIASVGTLEKAEISLGRSTGLDDAQVLDFLGAGMAGSRALEVKRPKHLTEDYSPGGSIGNQLTDLRIALATADELGLSLPVTALVTDTYQRLSDESRSGLDHSAIVLAIEVDQRDGAARPDRSPLREPRLTDPLVDPKAGI